MPAVALKLLSCSQHSELILLSQHHPFPVPIFPAALCGTRVVFLFKQFPSELETEAKVILTLLTKLIGGETGPGEARPGLGG
jgi:hypothetical protein